jgi:hypothetical protein
MLCNRGSQNFYVNEQRHEISTRISKDHTVYKYIKEHYPVSKEHLDACERYVESPSLYQLCL